MDFSFSEEQELLRGRRESSSASGSPVSGSPSSPIRRMAGTRRPGRSSPELGWTGVSVSEEEGGAGLGFLEEAVLFEELGRALYPGPYFSTIALALPALSAELRAQVVAGEATWTLALHGESGLVPDLGIVDRVAVVDDDGIWAVEGESREVLATMDSTRRLGRIGLDRVTRTPLVEGDGAVERPRRSAGGRSPRSHSRRWGSDSVRSSSQSSTRRRVSSSDGPSASTRPSRTRWPTRTPRRSLPARSPTGPPGA